MTSDTPRTDAVFFDTYGDAGEAQNAMYEIACKLEREVTNLSMRVMRKAEHAADWQSRCEQAGRELTESHSLRSSVSVASRPELCPMCGQSLKGFFKCSSR